MIKFICWLHLLDISTLVTDDRILYVENPKDATRKLLELISESGKVAGYKINTQKSIKFLYTNNKRIEREIKETVPFTTASKRIKYSGRNISKEAKTYTAKTIRPDERSQRWHKQMERNTMFLDWNNQYC